MALNAALHRLRSQRPQAVTRADSALRVALAKTRESCWPEVAWRASSLTNTGYPVELSWSSRDTSVRWTAETCGPEMPESERLGAALSVMRSLGNLLDLPPWLVPAADRFGAWAGGRHDDAGDRFKLYVDLAACHPSNPLEAIPSRTQWRMAGLDGTSVELYAKLSKPEPWEIARLFAKNGLNAAPVLALANELTHSTLPRASGLTLAIANDRVVAAGLIMHASPLFGGDETVSRRLRALARGHDWDISLYDAILGDDTQQYPGRHGMIGVGVTKDGMPWLQIGVRP